MNAQNKLCLECNNIFNRRANAKFCSRACMQKFNKKTNKICKLCGIVYKQDKFHGDMFCSSKCRNRVSGWIRSGKLLPTEIGILCPNCKKELIHRKGRKSIFCSHSCAITVTRAKKTKSRASCHPNKPLVSKGLCQSCWAKKYYSTNKIKHLELARKLRLKKAFGITVEQWDKIFDSQNGLCPICEKPIRKPNNPEGKRAAAVDHDHKTGRVRGLVHDQCNRFLIAKNNIESAKKLVLYLESSFDGRQL